MFAEIRTSLRPTFIVLLALTLLTGILYPLAMTGLAQVLMPAAANGSLIVDHGQIIGSELIGQDFAGAGTFHPRPSAAGKGYDAANSGATNLAPGSKDLRDAIAKRIAALRGDGWTGPIPGDLVTSSASGLDPEISPAAALAQVPRVAAARHIPAPVLRDLIAALTKPPLAGLLGEPRVNVLRLNLALMRGGATPTRE